MLINEVINVCKKNMSHTALMQSHAQMCTTLWGCTSHAVLYHIKQAGLHVCLSFSHTHTQKTSPDVRQAVDSLLHPIKRESWECITADEGKLLRKDWLAWAQSFIHCCGCLICCKKIRFPLLKACFSLTLLILLCRKDTRKPLVLLKVLTDLQHSLFEKHIIAR